MSILHNFGIPLSGAGARNGLIQPMTMHNYTIEILNGSTMDMLFSDEADIPTPDLNPIKLRIHDNECRLALRTLSSLKTPFYMLVKTWFEPYDVWELNFCKFIKYEFCEEDNSRFNWQDHLVTLSYEKLFIGNQKTGVGGRN